MAQWKATANYHLKPIGSHNLKNGEGVLYFIVSYSTHGLDNLISGSLARFPTSLKTRCPWNLKMQ